MKRLARPLIVVAALGALTFAISVVSGGTTQGPISCPSPDPQQAADCPQTVLQPQVCGGHCLYVNKCHARAAGWTGQSCETAIGFSRETEPGS